MDTCIECDEESIRMVICWIILGYVLKMVVEKYSQVHTYQAVLSWMGNLAGKLWSYLTWENTPYVFILFVVSYCVTPAVLKWIKLQTGDDSSTSSGQLLTRSDMKKKTVSWWSVLTDDIIYKVSRQIKC